MASTQLLINPIKGLQSKYNEEDFNKLANWKNKKAEQDFCDEHKVFVLLVNFLYKIEIDDKDKKLFWKTLKRNKKMLESMKISKKEFSIKVIDAVLEALSYQYKNA